MPNRGLRLIVLAQFNHDTETESQQDYVNLHTWFILSN